MSGAGLPAIAAGESAPAGGDRWSIQLSPAKPASILNCPRDVSMGGGGSGLLKSKVVVCSRAITVSGTEACNSRMRCKPGNPVREAVQVQLHTKRELLD